MVAIGNFFFRYRNILFIFFYAALFLPSPPIFSHSPAADNSYLWPVLTGLFITCLGQLVRGLTIGLAYIVRGGKEGKPFAEGLVTEGLFHHSRNPLYVGNILMLLGIGILANSLLYVAIVIPLFIFIYQAIVRAEEDFLQKKFGEGYTTYCREVRRWWPRLRGMSATFSRMEFKWKRWILKEHTTQFIWLAGIVVILLLYYPQLSGNDTRLRNELLAIFLGILSLLYLFIRFLKKTGRFHE